MVTTCEKLLQNFFDLDLCIFCFNNFKSAATLLLHGNILCDFEILIDWFRSAFFHFFQVNAFGCNRMEIHTSESNSHQNIIVIIRVMLSQFPYWDAPLHWLFRVRCETLFLILSRCKGINHFLFFPKSSENLRFSDDFRRIEVHSLKFA